MMITTMDEYAKKRDVALIHFILFDDDTEIIRLMQRVGMTIPDNLDAFHGGLYKSARYCVNIPEYVKRNAWDKCKQLGMKPYIAEFETSFTLAKLERGEYVAADK